jgi:hypothetical protein
MGISRSARPNHVTVEFGILIQLPERAKQISVKGPEMSVTSSIESPIKTKPACGLRSPLAKTPRTNSGMAPTQFTCFHSQWFIVKVTSYLYMSCERRISLDSQERRNRIMNCVKKHREGEGNSAKRKKKIRSPPSKNKSHVYVTP